ncbi:MAG: metallophosphoesterase [Ignisphaera sp.]
MGELKISKEELEKMYVQEGMSTYEIADRLGCSAEVVRRKLIKYGIKRRPVNTTLQEVPSKEFLEKLYCKMKMSTLQIANLLDVNRDTVRRWLKQYGIPLRNLSEAAKIQYERERDFQYDMEETYYEPVKYEKKPRENIVIPIPLKLLTEKKKLDATLTLVLSDLHLGHTDFLPETFYSCIETLKQIITALHEKFNIKLMNVVLNGDIVSGREVYEFHELSNILPRGHWQVFLAEILIKEMLDELSKQVKIDKIILIKGGHESLAENYLLYLKRSLLGNGFKVIYSSKGLVFNVAEDLGKYNIFFTHGRGYSEYYPIPQTMMRELWKVVNQYKLAKIPVERCCIGHTHWLSTNLDLEGLLVDVTGGFQRWDKTTSQRPCGFILYLYSNDECTAVPVRPNQETEAKEKEDHALEYKNIRFYGSKLLKHVKEIEKVEATE